MSLPVSGLALRFQAGPIGSSRRPAPTIHGGLQPFDPSDPSGIVHTVLPPEQNLARQLKNPAAMLADFNGVTLDLARWGSDLPFLVGANSTPLAMLMTPMLILYPQKWIDADLTEHAERGYPDFILDPEPWNAAENGRTFSPAQLVAFCQYVRSWGFRIVTWRGNFRLGVDRVLQTLFDAGVIGYYVHGEEVDNDANHPGVTSQEYEASLDVMDRYIGGRVPIGTHFTAGDDLVRGGGYPLGAPRDDYLKNWSFWNGRVHLMQQLQVNASAGLQGANMYYARLRVNCGIGDGAEGPGAPDSEIVAFETSAFAQLYGRMSEIDGVRRSWELVCGTRNVACARPVALSGNGLWLPDGRPIVLAA